jgi:hypothetical protein
MHSLFLPFPNRLRLDFAIFGLEDLTDDHLSIQPTVLGAQKSHLSVEQNILQAIKKQTLKNFISTGDGSSRHRAAMLRSFGV